MINILNILIFAVLTTLPILILIGFIYYNDKIEKEPLSLLLLLFIGGIVSSVISYFISSYIKANIAFLNYDYKVLDIFQLFFKSLVSIALIEESLKWIVNFLTTWKNKNFNYMYDQIVYSSFVALGFALFENIVYCRYFSRYGYIPMILRGIISIPSHAVFGIVMGYYLAIAKNAKEKINKKKKYFKYLFKSIAAPILLHTIFNFILFKLNTFFSVILIIFLIGIYLYALQRIKKLSRNKTLLK